MPIRVDDHSHIFKLEACLAAVKMWMSSNVLLLNADKTEMLVVGPARLRHQFDNLTLTLDSCVISQSMAAKNLGVTFDPCLSFDKHIREITQDYLFSPTQ